MPSPLRYRVRWWFRRHWDQFRAPWPIVGECHWPAASLVIAGHTCGQCDGSHDHDWRAWPDAPNWVTSGPGIPIRCRICGGRKCDAEDCQHQRHDGHTHWDAA